MTDTPDPDAPFSVREAVVDRYLTDPDQPPVVLLCPKDWSDFRKELGTAQSHQHADSTLTFSAIVKGAPTPIRVGISPKAKPFDRGAPTPKGVTDEST